MMTSAHDVAAPWRQPGLSSVFQGIALAFLLSFWSIQPALAQANVKAAIDVIVTFCVAGGEKSELSSTGTGNELELKKEGAASSAGITLYSKSQAKGLVDGINNAMTNLTARQASEARKCMQPYIDRIVDIYLNTAPSGSLSLPSISSWAHNNSIVSIRSAGNKITIVYEQPRQGMINEGVQNGTVLFAGQRTGNRLSGTSYVFDRHCNPIPYSDDGVVSNEREIVLNGRRVPTQLADCQPVAYRVDPGIFYRRD